MLSSSRAEGRERKTEREWKKERKKEGKKKKTRGKKALALPSSLRSWTLVPFLELCFIFV